MVEDFSPASDAGIAVFSQSVQHLEPAQHILSLRPRSHLASFVLCINEDL